jgi:hypothetical protein
MNPFLIPLVLALLVLPVEALAITTSTQPPGGRAVAPPKSKQEPPATQRDDSSGLRKGAVDAVSAKGTLGISGQTLKFDPRQVRIFGADGKPRSIGALQKGTHISFLLDPRDASRQRVSVIYLK